MTGDNLINAVNWINATLKLRDRVSLFAAVISSSNHNSWAWHRHNDIVTLECDEDEIELRFVDLGDDNYDWVQIYPSRRKAAKALWRILI